MANQVARRFPSNPRFLPRAGATGLTCCTLCQPISRASESAAGGCLNLVPCKAALKMAAPLETLTNIYKLTSDPGEDVMSREDRENHLPGEQGEKPTAEEGLSRRHLFKAPLAIAAASLAAPSLLEGLVSPAAAGHGRLKLDPEYYPLR